MKLNGKPIREKGDDTSIDTRPWIQIAIDEHEGSLLRYAQSLLGDLDRARDVVQDTFMQLVKSDRSEIESRLRPWLFKVCRNRIIDICRKESRMSFADSHTLDQNTVDARGPDAVAEDRETSAHLRSLIGNLTTQQQEVLRLKFQSAMSYKEISQVLNLTVSNVGFILHTAIQKVRKRANAEFELDSN